MTRELDIGELVFVRFGYDLYDSPSPPLVDMMHDAPFRGRRFPDCGETAVRNFINALSYYDVCKKLDVTLLATLGFHDNVVRLLRKYPTSEAIKTPRAHGDWAEVVAGLPGVSYGESRGGKQLICNIEPGLDNMVRVLGGIWKGVTSFQLCTERRKTVGITMTVEPSHPLSGPSAEQFYRNNTLKIILEKPGTLRDAFLWTFTAQHFGFKDCDARDIMLAHVGHALDQRKHRLSFAHACVYASAGANYQALLAAPALANTSNLGGTLFFALGNK